MITLSLFSQSSYVGQIYWHIKVLFHSACMCRCHQISCHLFIYLSHFVCVIVTQSTGICKKEVYLN